MKKPFKIFSILIAVLLLWISEVGVLMPSDAHAGVLTRGGTSKGLSIGKPKSHDRNVRKSTAAMRATAPPLAFKGESTTDRYASLQRANLKYEKRYYKWEQKKYKFEQRAYRKEQKEKEAIARADMKKREQLARASKPHPQGAAVEQAKAAASSAIDPRTWFSKNIAKQEQGGLLSLNAIKGKGDEKAADGKGTEVKGTPKHVGFWGHLKRAIFGI